MWIYLQCGARSRVVHDRVRGYTYSFYPTGVVHRDLVAPRLARSDPIDFEAPVYCDETNGYNHHPAFPV